MAANVGLIATLFGVGSLLVVALYLNRVGISGAIRAGWMAVAAVAFGVALVLSEPFRVIVFEALTFVVVAVTVAALSGAALFLLQERTGPLLEVLVLGPLAVASVFLSVILGGLATPTLGRPIGEFTAAVVRFLLLEVLTVGGLNRVLQDLFELDAVGTVAFWIAVTVLLGWGLAIAARRYEKGRLRTGEGA
jgi:hypothetical protein